MSDPRPCAVDVCRLRLALGRTCKWFQAHADAPRQMALTSQDLFDIMELFTVRADVKRLVKQALRGSAYQACCLATDTWLVDVVPGLLHQVCCKTIPVDEWRRLASQVPAPSGPASSRTEAASLDRLPGQPQPPPPPPSLALVQQGSQPDEVAAQDLVVRGPNANDAQTLSMVRLPPRRDALEQYGALHHDQLVALLVSRDEAIRDLRKKLKVSRQSEKRTSKALAVVQAAPASDSSVFSLTKKSKGKGKQLTTSGSLALALRCIMSSSAGNKVGLALLEDVSHQTANRAISLLGACLVVRSSAFHAAAQETLACVHMQAVAAAPANVCLQISGIAFSSDATNSEVWQKSKVHTTEIRSSYLMNAEMLQERPYHECVQTCYALADVQRVLSGTAGSTYSMLKKQLSSLGCPLWPEAWPCRGEEEQAQVCESAWRRQLDVATEQRRLHIKVFMYTSDGGSDQNKFKKAAITASITNLFYLFIAWPCLMHAGALVSKGGLTLVDDWLCFNKVSWKFFSSTAKIMHVWRDLAKLVFRIWCDGLWVHSAIKNAAKLPPCAISGRWGTMSAVLERLVTAEPGIRRVLPEALPLPSEVEPRGEDCQEAQPLHIITAA